MATTGGHRVRRCSMCGVSWPSEEQFKTCFDCGGETDFAMTSSPPDLSLEEATSRQRHFEFERYLEKHDRD